MSDLLVYCLLALVVILFACIFCMLFGTITGV